MRSCLVFSCFAVLITGTCNVPSIAQREVSTIQRHLSISDTNWPKGLFYGLQDTLYWLTFSDRKLTIVTIIDGNIKPDRITVDYSDIPGVFRMRAVTSNSRDTLFVLFSGNKQLIAMIDLRERVEAQRIPYSVPGYTNTIRYIANWDTILVVGQSSSVLVHKDGTYSRFGPEIFHGINCCSYVTGAASDNAVTLNVEGGLRLYSRKHENLIWEESESGFISEVASAGEAWAAIETGYSGKPASIRVFLPNEPRYSHYVFSLPEPGDPHAKGDGYWRITDNGNQAVAWSRRSDTLFRISDQTVDKFKLKDTTPLGRVCPAFSDNAFLIDSEGYTVISFD